MARAAKDHLEILASGLVISVIMMALAANLIAMLIHKHRWLAWMGLAVVVCIACDVIVRGDFPVAAAMA